MSSAIFDPDFDSDPPCAKLHNLPFLRLICATLEEALDRFLLRVCNFEITWRRLDNSRSQEALSNQLRLVPSRSPGECGSV
jgi:hypothetical protein